MKKRENIIEKAPARHVFLSMIFPGAGQFYAGDLKNGFNSLILNAGLLTWFVSYAFTYSTIDAAFTIGPWFYRYYLGGFQRAGKMVTIKKGKTVKPFVLENYSCFRITHILIYS